MFGILALLFVVVPIVELMVLIQLGQAVGLGPTLLLVLATGVGGAMLARAEGLRTFLRFQGEVASGEMPSQSIFDGISVLIGGVLLLTPGLLTDVLGFSLLVPFTRRWLQRRAKGALARAAANGSIQIVTMGPSGFPFPPSDLGEEVHRTQGLDPSNEIVVEDDPASSG